VFPRIDACYTNPPPNRKSMNAPFPGGLILSAKQSARFCLSVALAVGVGLTVRGDEEGLAFFESKIRPVLVKECYACHSAEASKTGKLRGGLWLDTRQGTQQGGESGPAVVPGKPDESLLLAAIRHEAYEMPPKGKLPEAVIEDFASWIEMGAPDPREGSAAAAAKSIDMETGKQFWSFQPWLPTTPPAVDASWAQTPVDRFVWQRLQAEGIEPNECAEPRVLVRRAWFDLLGLPPSPEEMERWVARLSGEGTEPTESSQASSRPRFDRRVWAELVEHLLSSPHYGERWARHWMDVARFAESHGYEQDYDRPHAYFYRDFLIRAFNEDLPYDRFVQWQLAGDEIDPQNPWAWMATGFLGGGAFPTQLTEAEFESARYDELDDMVATTGVAFLGLSVGCARCHDHKFDPIPSSDYYRLAATFTSAIRTEREFDLEPEENARRQADFDAERQELRTHVERIERDEVPVAFLDFLRSAKSLPSPSPWRVLQGEITSSAKTKFRRLEDGSYLAGGKAAAKEVLTFQTRLDSPRFQSLRLEALSDASLPKHGPGRAENGNFVLSRLEVMARPIASPSTPEPAEQRLPLASASATHQQNATSLSVTASLDKADNSGWAVGNQSGIDQAAVFALAEPVAFSGPVELTIRLTCNHPNKQHTLGRFRLSLAEDPSAPVVVGDHHPSEAIKQSLARLRAAAPPAKIADASLWIEEHREDWQPAVAWFRATFAPWQQADRRLSQHQATGPQLKLSKAMVTSEGFPHLPHHADGRGFPHFYPVTYQLRRGDVAQKGDVAEPGFLQVLLQDDGDPESWKATPTKAHPSASYRRSALARWLTDPRQGAGQLVARVMANRLWQHHFGRGLVATPNDFGASGEPPTHPELLDWLAQRLVDEGWRMKAIHREIMMSNVYLQSAATRQDLPEDPRFAVDPDNRLYWRRTPQRLEAEAIRDAMLAVSGQLDRRLYGPGTLDQDMTRRSIYFFIKRSGLIPMLMLFDWPEHLVSIGQRASTTIAPQALMFINSPQGRRYAEGFAGQLTAKTRPRAIEQAYRLAYGRLPDEDERAIAEAFLEQQSRSRPDLAAEAGLAAALADFCQVLMSANEFVYIE
jgi:hypothetical protein